ncbi:MAG TPA: molecular chaperone DnaJ [Acidimicrobiales bacterium]|jgi:molecular chaperone DnaJ|nr:molecular chaperone DnaJ [Acidimicrobiales bacterium]
MAPQREWFEKDYYRILGVSDSASQKDIRKAYRKLSRQYHPDANPGDKAAEERFKEISAAYDVVGDAERRKEYDEVRKLGPVGGMFGGQGAGGPGGGPGGFRFEDLGDLGDVLGGLFGRARRRGPGGAGPGAARGTGPHRGQDLEAELHLSFEDAVGGLTTTVHLTSEAACSTCRGTGARPGTTPHACPRCGGRGVLDDNQGFFSFSTPCPECAGRGYVVDDPCPTCRGSGVEQRPREVKVRIPAGVDDGQRIRLRGRGGPGRNGGPAGDLYVTVRVAAHPLFGRRGDDLTLTVPITFPEAALGATVAVPTLGGDPVKVRIPAGTRSGRTLRVRGKGVARRRRTGDLLVTVEVAVPQKLTAEQRKAVEALAAASNGSSPRAHLGAEETTT